MMNVFCIEINTTLTNINLEQKNRLTQKSKPEKNNSKWLLSIINQFLAFDKILRVV
jgi:hypothetical protein